MTKQKQIEEIVDVMTASNNPFIDIPTEQMPKVAEALYNAGYRKTFTSDLASDTQKAFKEGYIKGSIDSVLLARKETAKEILNDLYFNLQDSVKGNVAKSNDYYNVMGWLEEIAKEYGVELEECGAEEKE